MAGGSGREEAARRLEQLIDAVGLVTGHSRRGSTSSGQITNATEYLCAAFPTMRGQPHHTAAIPTSQSSFPQQSTSGIANNIFQSNQRRKFASSKRKLPQTKERKTEAAQKVEKNRIYVKDVVMIPSPRIKEVPRGKAREALFSNDFVISSFELHTVDSESVIREKLVQGFKDLFPGEQALDKFEFVRVVEKRIVPVKIAGEFNGKSVYNIAGQRDRPIYLRAVDDLRWKLGSKSHYFEVDNLSDSDTCDSIEENINSPISVKDEKNFATDDTELMLPKQERSLYQTPEINAIDSACPICGNTYPIDAIQSHVNECLDFKSAFLGKNSIEEPMTEASKVEADSLQEILSERNKTFCKESIKKTKFSVRLRHAYVDTVKKMKLFQSDASLKPISVDFIGEVAVDDGGPLRELFTTIFDSAANHILSGQEKNYTIRHDAHKLESGEFEIYGKLIALSFLQGGPGPHNWCRPLANYVFGLDCSEISITDISDFEVQEKLHLVIKSQSQEELDNVLLDFDARFEAGYNKLAVDMSDVEDLVKKVTRYFVISRQLEEIQQVCTGMASKGILQILRKYPKEAVEEFVHAPHKVTAEMIKEMYVIQYDADVNSEHRQKEEDIIFWWYQFLDELEIGQAQELEVFDLSSSDKKAVKLTLLDVFRFLTGAKYLPSINIIKQKGKITFIHDCPGRRLSTSTCLFLLKFPVNERYCSELFSSNVVEDIMQSPGFGLAYRKVIEQ
eukprot:gene10666-11795_t